MEPAAYAEMALQEEAHWWFKGRRAITHSVLQKEALPQRIKILEVGCGYGGNLPLLAQFGEVYACEMFNGARAIAQARKIGIVEDGKLPNELPFEGQSFDLIALFDVLEHIENDAAALSALQARLNPHGPFC